jgi:hypothetical protein
MSILISFSPTTENLEAAENEVIVIQDDGAVTNEGNDSCSDCIIVEQEMITIEISNDDEPPTAVVPPKSANKGRRWKPNHTLAMPNLLISLQS